jgi:hypothetical protein
MSKRIRNDDGVTLIIAILIITVVAVVTGALLSQGATNFKATVALRQVAGSAYAADTAAKIAIGDLQLGENASDSGASYPNVGFTTTTRTGLAASDSAVPRLEPRSS